LAAVAAAAGTCSFLPAGSVFYGQSVMAEAVNLQTQIENLADNRALFFCCVSHRMVTGDYHDGSLTIQGVLCMKHTKWTSEDTFNDLDMAEELSKALCLQGNYLVASGADAPNHVVYSTNPQMEIADKRCKFYEYAITFPAGGEQ